MREREKLRRIGQKKVEFWVDEILHQKIKLMAVSHNIPMKKYILQAVTARMVQDEELSK